MRRGEKEGKSEWEEEETRIKRRKRKEEAADVTARHRCDFHKSASVPAG